MQAKTQSSNPLMDTAKFFYLFTRDIVSIPGLTAEQYDAREPGYSVPYFSAYIAAFQEPTKGRITHEFLKKINTIALQHLPESTTGEYRTKGGHFSVDISTYTSEKNLVLVPSFNATVNGIFSYLSKWILGVEKPTHGLMFVSKKNGLEDHYFLAYIEGSLVLRRVVNGLATNEPFHEGHLELIRNLILDHNYSCHFDVAFTEDNSTIQQETHLKIQSVIDSFDAQMAKAKTDDDKIRIIAAHVQEIDQIHPFKDGNIRTCYILLNKLLHDYKLPLTVLYNPNRFDACSVDDLVSMIKEGQLIYQQLMSPHHSDTFIVKTDELGSEFKTIQCPADTTTSPDLLLQFQTLVIQGQLLNEEAMAQTAEKIIQSILHPDCRLCDLQFGISIELPTTASPTDIADYVKLLESTGMIVQVFSSYSPSLITRPTKLIIHNETLESFIETITGLQAVRPNSSI